MEKRLWLIQMKKSQTHSQINSLNLVAFQDTKVSLDTIMSEYRTSVKKREFSEHYFEVWPNLDKCTRVVDPIISASLARLRFGRLLYLCSWRIGWVDLRINLSWVVLVFQALPLSNTVMASSITSLIHAPTKQPSRFSPPRNLYN